MRPRESRRGIVFGLAAVILLIVGGVAGIVIEHLVGGGAANETRITPYQDWRITCPPITAATPNCALTEDVQRDTGGLLLQLSIVDAIAGKPLTLTVPHGVLLEPGLGFAIGTEPMRVRPYETCTPAGCFALVTLDADTLKSMRANMGGQVTIAVPGATMPVNLPFSLRGFADGYAALERANAQRTGMFSFLYR
jgi:invasion protein IalB